MTVTQASGVQYLRQSVKLTKHHKQTEILHLLRTCKFFFFFLWQNSPTGAQASPLLRLHDHTQTHHTWLDSPRRGIGPSQRPLPDSTQHSQETDIHAPGGIRTRNPSKRAAADPPLRPRGHWDRHTCNLLVQIIQVQCTGVNDPNMTTDVPVYTRLDETQRGKKWGQPVENGAYGQTTLQNIPLILQYWGAC